MGSSSDSSDYENRRQYLEAARKRREEAAQYTQAQEMVNHRQIMHEFDQELYEDFYIFYTSPSTPQPLFSQD